MPDEAPDSPLRDGEERPADERGGFMFAEFVRESPIATAVLILCMLAGAWGGHEIFAETLGPGRRVIGGALAGFGCWLCVMVGRVI